MGLRRCIELVFGITTWRWWEVGGSVFFREFCPATPFLGRGASPAVARVAAPTGIIRTWRLNNYE